MRLTHALFQRLLGSLTALGNQAFTTVPATVITTGGTTTGTGVNVSAWPAPIRAESTIQAIVGPFTMQTTIEQSATGSGGWTTLYTFPSQFEVGTILATISPTQPYVRGSIGVSGFGATSITIKSRIVATAPQVVAAGSIQMGLFTSVDDRGLATTYADLERVTASGLTSGTITAWASPQITQDGSWKTRGAKMVFRPASSASASTPVGWYWATLDASPILLGWDYFPAPAPLVDQFSALTLVPTVTVGPNGVQGMVESFSG